MATYRRSHATGATWFFTVASHHRLPILVRRDVLLALRHAITQTRERHPFEIVAWVVLPDHMHALWTLPEADGDYALRWALIKRQTAQAVRDAIPPVTSKSMQARGEIGLRRRYWEHQIHDENDLLRHIDYIHFNPVKHGLVASPNLWSHSTFHRYVREGLLPTDWMVGSEPSMDGGFGE